MSRKSIKTLAFVIAFVAIISPSMYKVWADCDSDLGTATNPCDGENTAPSCAVGCVGPPDSCKDGPDYYTRVAVYPKTGGSKTVGIEDKPCTKFSVCIGTQTSGDCTGIIFLGWGCSANGLGCKSCSASPGATVSTIPSYKVTDECDD